MNLRTLTLTVVLAGVAPVATAGAQDDAIWRSVDISRQLRDSQPQRIRVQYAAGRVDVRASADPLLYALHLRYDERTAQPVHRYDAGDSDHPFHCQPARPQRSGAVRVALVLTGRPSATPQLRAPVARAYRLWDTRRVRPCA